MIRSLLHKLAENVILFEIFEKIFGADKQKKIIYRQAFQNGKQLLDFGCSTGNTTEAFLDFDYTGVDLDPTCIRYAKKRWKNYPNVRFVCKDILKKPFKAQSFDFVLFAGTGHHIPDSQIASITSGLIHTLKKDGELWFYDILKPDSSTPFLAKLLASLDRGRFIRSQEQYNKLFTSLKKVVVIEEKRIKIVDTLIPQEDYCFYRLKKR
jgi:SAM-dependent methyltransferase